MRIAPGAQHPGVCMSGYCMSNGEIIVLALLAVAGFIAFVAFSIQEWRHQRRLDLKFTFARGYREGYGEHARGLPPRDFP